MKLNLKLLQCCGKFHPREWGPQTLTAVRGRDCDGLGGELVVKVPCVDLRRDLRLEGWQELWRRFSLVGNVEITKQARQIIELLAKKEMFFQYNTFFQGFT